MLGTCGKFLFANIVALGAVNELTHCVSEEALEKAVLNRVPKGTEEANKKALQAGKNLIKIIKNREAMRIRLPVPVSS